MIKLKLQNRTGKNLFLAGGQRMNRNIDGTFFYRLEEVATERNLSDTTRSDFNIDISGIQINNKPVCVITENASKNILSSGTKGKNMTVM